MQNSFILYSILILLSQNTWRAKSITGWREVEGIKVRFRRENVQMDHRSRALQIGKNNSCTFNCRVGWKRMVVPAWGKRQDRESLFAYKLIHMVPITIIFHASLYPHNISFFSFFLSSFGSNVIYYVLSLLCVTVVGKWGSKMRTFQFAVEIMRLPSTGHVQEWAVNSRTALWGRPIPAFWGQYSCMAVKSIIFLPQ